MERHRLELIGITYNQIESGVYAVILREIGGTRRIPIIIGYPEAQAIECKLQEVATPRPLTHDMMMKCMNEFGITLKEIEIRKLPSGVFTADLVFSDGRITRIVDSRSSDGIALAIRAGAPIYTSEEVLLEAGFNPGENGDVSPVRSQRRGAPATAARREQRPSLSQLYSDMQKAAENEDYELAAKIKEEIDRRRNENE